jgi:hypothetical protein
VRNAYQIFSCSLRILLRIKASGAGSLPMKLAARRTCRHKNAAI